MPVELPVFSLVIPTYRRIKDLITCLDAIRVLNYPRECFEVLVIDNWGDDSVGETVNAYTDCLNIKYLKNDRNRGYGYSVNRGISNSCGNSIVILNDDAVIPPDFLNLIEHAFTADQGIGCVGCRAIEAGYENSGEGVGRISDSGEVIGNFNIDCGRGIEVEHVYGFCYAFTRPALEAAGPMDQVLLAKSYSNGNRVETDHCLLMREKGFKVFYDPRIAVVHHACPRADMEEQSSKWWVNEVRNTLYLFLKHYGLFGKKSLALRYSLLKNSGLWAFFKKPSLKNLFFIFLMVWAKSSALFHYFLFLLKK